MIRLVALLLTVMTGFSGLVYEVAWQKYLATLLGSHSEATASVLAIFLGGLSVGYWLFGQVTRRHVIRSEEAGVPPRLLLIYGALEAGIGVYVIAFPWLFQGVQAISYALPHGTGGFGFVIDVLLATILIGPASVLMGGTIPILTQGLARSLDDATRFHAFVYAFNTAGAFVGALAAGFYLIPALGLVRVMLAMGCINLVAGSIFMALGVRGRAVISLETGEDGEGGELEGFAVYAAVALLTGFAMMTIQTSIIRVAGLSFGSSQFTFSMVVAVFVLCIALGSFVVSALGTIPTWVVVGNQWLLALLFVLLYPRLDELPHWIWVLRTLFQNTDAAFTVYYLAGFAVILLVLGVPVLLSGAALPLLFHHMRRQVDHLGDLAGTLYSWNTVGSLLGALLGGYALFFWLDLDHVTRIAIAALLAAALLLTLQVRGARMVWAGLLLPLFIAVALLPRWDPELLYAGLFRQRDPVPFAYDGIESIRENQSKWFADNIIYFEDDPITSVTVRKWDHDGVESLSISTNGKSDGDTYADYATMGLVAVVSAMLADEAKSAFVIGWGTGVTAGELASFESIERVDVAEISPGVMNAAPLFDFADMNASKNPKIHVIESDAYRALMRNDDTYDLIVSEPSNPWVAGVEMLFSREFLQAAKSKLSEGGVYCQWFHQYEVDEATVALVLRTYRDVFDHVVVWRANASDLMIFGFNKAGPAKDHYRLEARSAQPDYEAALRRSGVVSFAALVAHEVLPLGVVHAATLDGPIHTLYHPILSDLAGRAFYRNERGELPFTGYGEAAEVGRRNSMARAYFERFAGELPDDVRSDFIREYCVVSGPRCQPLLAHWLESHSDIKGLQLLRDDLIGADGFRTLEAVRPASRLFGDERSVAEIGPIDPGLGFSLTQDYMRSYSHGVPFSPRALESVWTSCRQRVRTRAQCERTLAAQPASSADLDAMGAEADLEARIEHCVTQPPPSRLCRDGGAQVRTMLETGEMPPLLEAWRLKREQIRGS